MRNKRTSVYFNNSFSCSVGNIYKLIILRTGPSFNYHYSIITRKNILLLTSSIHNLKQTSLTNPKVDAVPKSSVVFGPASRKANSSSDSLLNHLKPSSFGVNYKVLKKWRQDGCRRTANQPIYSSICLYQVQCVSWFI